MPGLLADVNAEGHLRAILTVCRGAAWREFWHSIGVTVHTFTTAGLPTTTPDDELWDWCQGRDTLLLTSNRNARGPDSVQATIVKRGSVRDLPVLTLSDPDRVLRDRAYVEDVAVRVMAILDELERSRGSGRLWLP